MRTAWWRRSTSTRTSTSRSPQRRTSRAPSATSRSSPGWCSGLDVLPVVANGLLAAEPTFPEEFAERCCAGSYYDDLIVRSETTDGLRVTVSYETDPEDEYDEYSSSYVYLTFSAQ